MPPKYQGGKKDPYNNKNKYHQRPKRRICIFKMLRLVTGRAFAETIVHREEEKRRRTYN